MVPWVPWMEPTSTVAHPHSKGKQLEIEREVYPRTVWHAVALICDSSTCLVGGMDRRLMPHCTMMHVSMTFLFLRGGTILPMLDLVHVTRYLFHIEVSAIILQNGAAHP